MKRILALFLSLGLSLFLQIPGAQAALDISLRDLAIVRINVIDLGLR